jgi:hypothetical protein
VPITLCELLNRRGYASEPLILALVTRAGGPQQTGHGGTQPHAGRARCEQLAPQDTALYLGISRELVWAKMRKYQIFD